MLTGFQAFADSQLETLPPLDDAHYTKAHQAFRAATNQQQRIEDWFASDFASLNRDSLNLLSVGCGSGILDAQLLASLQRVCSHVRYTGIDPNVAAIAEFKERMEAALQPDNHCHADAVLLDDFEPQTPFDYILVVQAMYYMPDLAGAVRRCEALLAEGGKLVIVNAPCEALCQLTDVIWSQRLSGPWYSADIEQECNQLGLTYTKERLSAQLDVTPCLQSHQHSLVLDFILQAKSAHLPDTMRNDIAAYLQSHAHRDGEKWLMPHPVDIFSISKAADEL